MRFMILIASALALSACRPPADPCEAPPTPSRSDVPISVDDNNIPKTLDGVFTPLPDVDARGCPNADHEWVGVTPMQGLYTNLDVDYDDGRFVLLNDWFLNDKTEVDPNCFNLSRSGSLRWRRRPATGQCS